MRAPREDGRGEALLEEFLSTGRSRARDAETLMRSRYAANERLAEAVRAQDAASTSALAHYLHQSWAPESRPPMAELVPEDRETAASQAVTWRRLKVLDVVQGAERAEVEFVAVFTTAQGTRDRLHERSIFRRDQETGWLYVTGEVFDS